MTERVHSNPLGAWGRILRLPNLFSVPGDPLAGFLLAGGVLSARPAEMLFCCAGSLFAYISGLIGNDLADLEQDRAERPNRPLPSGAISPSAAKTAWILSIALSLLFCSFHWAVLLCAVLLNLAILMYNRRWKAPFPMGLCRFLNIALGTACAGAADWRGLIFAGLYATGVLLYIAGVTTSAADETKAMKKRPGGTLFFTGAVLCYLTLFVRMGFTKPEGIASYLTGAFSALAAAVFVVAAFRASRRFRGYTLPGETQFWIGFLIWNLIFLQTAAVTAAGAWITGIALALCAAGAKISAKKIHGS